MILPRATALLVALGALASTLTPQQQSTSTSTPIDVADERPDELESDEDDAGSVDLGSMTVSADWPPGDAYRVFEGSTATKTNTPLREIPLSVQVVSRQLLEDQGALGLEDVYRNVSGVVQSGNTRNAQSDVAPVIRGFESPLILRDGLRATQVGAVDLQDIESVEVLKGPASILYGSLEPGGVVNYTTKKPLDEPLYDVDVQVGSFDHMRAAVDASGPVAGSDSLLYRLNLAYTDSGSFRDEVELERVVVSSSLAWVLGDTSRLTFDASYAREETPFDSGLPVGFSGEELVPNDTFFNDPTLAGQTLEDLFIGTTLEHDFDDDTRSRSRLQFHRATPENEGIRPLGVLGTPGAEELRIRYQNEERVDDEFQLVSDLVLDRTSGGVEHEILLGLDVIYQESEFDRFRQNLPNVPITPNPMVMFTPGPGNEPVPAFESSQWWAAFYVQDQMSLLEDGSLKLLVGGRVDYVEQDQDIPTRTSVDNFAPTGRVGLLYEATDSISPYVSFTQSFSPQGPTIVDQSGDILDPETGVQYEAGVKMDFLDEQVQVTTAVYQIKKEDVAVLDRPFFINTGMIAFFPGVDQRSRGFELDFTGELTESVSVVGNYAYTDTEVLQNREDPAMVGNRLGNVPLQASRLWLSYDLLPGSDQDEAGLGAGVRYESERIAQFDDDIELDDYVVFDIGAWYRRTLQNGQTVEARLNIQNVTDKDYFVRAADQSIVHPGSPLALLFSLEFSL